MDKHVLKQIKEFEKGDYLKISWFDASDARGPLAEHKKPECLVDEWGVFLGYKRNRNACSLPNMIITCVVIMFGRLHAFLLRLSKTLSLLRSMPHPLFFCENIC